MRGSMLLAASLAIAAQGWASGDIGVQRERIRSKPGAKSKRAARKTERQNKRKGRK